MARMNRRNLIDLSECTCYHVISRCTRQLHLLGTDPASRAERKGLLLKQLERLASFTAVGIAGWSVMDNHLHWNLRGLAPLLGICYTLLTLLLIG